MKYMAYISSNAARHSSVMHIPCSLPAFQLLERQLLRSVNEPRAELVSPGPMLFAPALGPPSLGLMQRPPDQELHGRLVAERVAAGPHASVPSGSVGRTSRIAITWNVLRSAGLTSASTFKRA